MGKKKKTNQNSNNTCSIVDSSESESSTGKDSTQTNEGSKKLCTHICKSVELSTLRKYIKTNKEKNKHNVCSLCKKKESEPCKDGWVCLRCGSCNCGSEEEDHRVDHYKTPRSDSHLLAYQLSTSIIWCFKCERELPIDLSIKIQKCVEFIKKQYNDHLPFNSVKVQTDTKNMNGESTNYMKDESPADQASHDVCLNKMLNKCLTVLNLPEVRGLLNLGNTCYFNSVLQCLAQTSGLVDLLREMDVPGERFHLELDGTVIDAVLEKHKSSVLTEQLAQILTEVSGLHSGSGDTNSKPWTGYAVNPKRLLDALTSKYRQFEGGDQHDAHELLRHLLDSVHTEDLRRYQKAILDHIGYSNNMDTMDEDKKMFGKKLNQKVCETIPIRPDQIFKGSLVSILECTVCHHISKREETFLDLSLPVAQERAQPPIVRRKQNCSSPVEEKQTTEVTMSKHQLKKEKKNERKNRKNARRNGSVNKKDEAQGELNIEEEDKKDSLDGEQSDADVEDNEDNVCEEEQDHKTEIVESGYSSEKQMSTRGSPVNTQSLEEESKCEFKVDVQECPVFQGCEPSSVYNKTTSERSMFPNINSFCEDADALIAKRAESGLGSIQELTVTIVEEGNVECTSQDSVRVNTSNGSPISSDSQHGNFKTADSTSNSFKVPPSSSSQIDRKTMVENWDCMESFKKKIYTTSVQNRFKEDSENVLAKGDEYGLMGTQELTVTIPEVVSVEDSSLSSSEFQMPQKSEGQMDRTSVVRNWDCTGNMDSYLQNKESSSLCLPVNLGYSSQPSPPNDNSSPKGSPMSGSHSNDNDNMSASTSLPHSNDNSLPENVSMILNSPIKSQNSQREENSGSEERPESRMECRKNRSSPVELGELTGLDSGLLKISLEGMTCAENMEDTDGAEAERRSSPVVPESPEKQAEPSYNTDDQVGLALAGGTIASKAIPLPPPLPLFSSQYSFNHSESLTQRYKYSPVLSSCAKYKNDDGDFSLQSCLTTFTTIEMLAGGNKVSCEACTEKTNKGNKEGKTVYQNSTKQLLICKLPPVVIFHLKRFQVQRCSFRKISRHVDFPLVFDISPFCRLNEDEKESDQILYSLYGVVEHSGTLHGGHYVAYVKVRSHADRSPGCPPPGRWYYVSDSRVSSIEESAVLKTQAYLLFYERIL